MFEFDKKYFSKYNIVAGIDEAGRGPLAGPVVAASVIFDGKTCIEGVNDSKKISEKKRISLYSDIVSEALHVGIGIVHSDEIDEINILNATKKAMKLSILDLGVIPDFLLVDGNQIEFSDYKQESIVKGDSKSFSIAAASIIAKVTRDNIMFNYAKILPEYGFEGHKGYGTKNHIKSIQDHKASIIHRKSYRPIKEHLPSFDYYIENNIVDELLIQIAGDYLIKKSYNISSINGLAIIASLNKKNTFFSICSNLESFDVQPSIDMEMDKGVMYQTINIKFKKGGYNIKVS